MGGPTYFLPSRAPSFEDGTGEWSPLYGAAYVSGDELPPTCIRVQRPSGTSVLPAAAPTGWTRTEETNTSTGSAVTFEVSGDVSVTDQMDLLSSVRIADDASPSSSNLTMSWPQPVAPAIGVGIAGTSAGAFYAFPYVTQLMITGGPNAAPARLDVRTGQWLDNATPVPVDASSTQVIGTPTGAAAFVSGSGTSFAVRVVNAAGDSAASGTTYSAVPTFTAREWVSGRIDTVSLDHTNDNVVAQSFTLGASSVTPGTAAVAPNSAQPSTPVRNVAWCGASRVVFGSPSHMTVVSFDFDTPGSLTVTKVPYEAGMLGTWLGLAEDAVDDTVVVIRTAGIYRVRMTDGMPTLLGTFATEKTTYTGSMDWTMVEASSSATSGPLSYMGAFSTDGGTTFSYVEITRSATDPAQVETRVIPNLVSTPGSAALRAVGGFGGGAAFQTSLAVTPFLDRAVAGTSYTTQEAQLFDMPGVRSVEFAGQRDLVTNDRSFPATASFPFESMLLPDTADLSGETLETYDAEGWSLSPLPEAGPNGVRYTRTTSTISFPTLAAVVQGGGTCTLQFTSGRYQYPAGSAVTAASVSPTFKAVAWQDSVPSSKITNLPEFFSDNTVAFGDHFATLTNVLAACTPSGTLSLYRVVDQTTLGVPAPLTGSPITGVVAIEAVCDNTFVALTNDTAYFVTYDPSRGATPADVFGVVAMPYTGGVPVSLVLNAREMVWTNADATFLWRMPVVAPSVVERVACTGMVNFTKHLAAHSTEPVAAGEGALYTLVGTEWIADPAMWTVPAAALPVRGLTRVGANEYIFGSPDGVQRAALDSGENTWIIARDTSYADAGVTANVRGRAVWYGETITVFQSGTASATRDIDYIDGSGTATSTATPSPSSEQSSGFPAWAIAVIVLVLAILLGVAVVLLVNRYKSA